MRLEGLTQTDVAKAAGVSQSAVSRLLHRVPQRSGAAYLRLCSYIRQQHVPDEDAPDDVLAAVREVWDGTEVHATALAELVKTSRRLWPELADAEDRRSTAQQHSEPG